ncbi:MAG: guanylate kinase [Bdellovibrionales bacterium]|nr:guanylate kinase [Bdellovibrionales bacterium]
MATKPIIILVGPSGAGKSTFLEKVLGDYTQFRDIITYTTRPMRKGESEGNPYHFVTRERFEELIQEKFFVEWARVHDKYYGSPRNPIEEAWLQGLAIIMDLDVQGARAFKKEFPQALTVFIHPPSIDELRRRIVERDGGAPKDLDLRLENAQKEMAVSGEFDRQMINREFSQSYAELKKMIDELLKSS